MGKGNEIHSFKQLFLSKIWGLRKTAGASGIDPVLWRAPEEGQNVLTGDMQDPLPAFGDRPD